MIVFIEQDEDLYLVQTDAVELLLIYLDKLTTLREKKKILLAALFVMLFNEGHSDPELVNRISFALKGRKVLVDEIGIQHIGDRVLNVVLPMLEGG